MYGYVSIYIYIYIHVYTSQSQRHAATSANDRDSQDDPTDRVYRFDVESRYISVARLSQAL